MIEKELKLDLGAQTPFRILHITDTHLCYADRRDGERKIKLAEKRLRVFPNAEANLCASVLRAKKERALIVHTGDLIDFVSVKNLEAASHFAFDNDCFICAGNHEFSQYVGEAWEDEAYRNQSLPRVQACFNNDIRFSVREICGVKLIAIDNSYYLFDKFQLDEIKKQALNRKPMILLLHTPLYTPDLHDYMLTTAGQPCGYLCGSPDELVDKYPEMRARQQRPDEVTLETIDFIKSCPQIKCILAGHLHRDYTTELTPTITQYCTGLDTSMLITIS